MHLRQAPVGPDAGGGQTASDDKLSVLSFGTSLNKNFSCSLFVPSSADSLSRARPLDAGCNVCDPYVMPTSEERMRSGPELT